jgi:hypothetical protein
MKALAEVHKAAGAVQQKEKQWEAAAASYERSLEQYKATLEMYKQLKEGGGKALATSMLSLSKLYQSLGEVSVLPFAARYSQSRSRAPLPSSPPAPRSHSCCLSSRDLSPLPVLPLLLCG